MSREERSAGGSPHHAISTSISISAPRLPAARLPLLGFRAAFVPSAASTLAELAHMPSRSLAPSAGRAPRERPEARGCGAAGPARHGL